ncbi:aldehyde dehydrogenase [Hirschia baltica]|uniref:Betaine-aldehyde dehydrogenase n=1 Tax=Hirschia baltica (strain ATCC 49814 / DSM 5838 / IFAM 1418) TaxID=582402 RepID=C6XP55_HIRBI|nr:aldehyde dehydrogenase [Hirschia baltica]ACT60235.1 Betaine-aldehyde dehydrogenase [Hirschia baltica ATCC 49814]
MLSYEKLFIDGAWVAPLDGSIEETINPATGKPWAKVAFGGARDIDKAVEAAKRALSGPWGKMTAIERGTLLRRLADLYQANANALAELETKDSGRALRESRMDVGSHHQWYRWFASVAETRRGNTIPIDDTVHAYTSEVPVGVVGAITPWNVPLMITAWKLAPALAAGCTIVLKPAEQTPVTSLEFARLVEEAGFPPGVVNVVPGIGSIAGAALSSHRDVDKVSFTGEGQTAKTILQNSTGNMKRFSFELGGKAPHIIFEDADLEQAINAATNSSWALCGQSCALGARVLVQRSVYERVVEGFAERAKQVKVGNPSDPSIHMGPQAHGEQLSKTLSYIQSGVDEGARLVSGGKCLTEGDLAGGFFIEPTVFADVSNNMKIAREEIFGPVACLIPFETEDEAIAIANDSEFGLASGLWTRDMGRAHRVSSQIKAGMVWVNTYRYIRWSTPYGGMKASGWGRENGLEAMSQYLEVKTTIMSTTSRFPNAYAVEKE